MKTETFRRNAPAEKDLLQMRLNNIQRDVLFYLNQLPASEQQVMLTLSDGEFWAQAQQKAHLQEIINRPSPVKTEQEEYAENREAFMEHLQTFGGVHKTRMVERLTTLSTPTIIKYGENNKLIVLNWGAENLYPAFQFTTNEDLSEKGVLRGISELLSLMRYKVSAVRKCNFFTREVELPQTGEVVSVLEVLQRGATEQEMDYFRVLAENFGTQNAV
ncbi:hypothetical protein [Pantoea sp. y20]